MLRCHWIFRRCAIHAFNGSSPTLSSFYLKIETKFVCACDASMASFVRWAFPWSRVKRNYYYHERPEKWSELTGKIKLWASRVESGNGLPSATVNIFDAPVSPFPFTLQKLHSDELNNEKIIHAFWFVNFAIIHLFGCPRCLPAAY